MKTTFQIWRNGRCFAEFTEGEPAREPGTTWNQETVIREFKDCKTHWLKLEPRMRYRWELRIISLPDTPQP